MGQDNIHGQSKVKYFSMFSGIGGFEKAIENATDNAWECVGYSEIDRYAINTYRKHYPGHRNFGDATKIRTDELPDFDFLCAGFPCQSFSLAGDRKGFEDTRGTLFFEIARILRDKKPSYFLLENVKGILNHDDGNTIRTILRTLDELHYDIQIFCLNSRFFGVPQNRERVFIVGNTREKHRPEILSFKDSSSEIDKTQQQVSSTIMAGYYKGGGRDQQYVTEANIDYFQGDVSGKGYKSQHDRVYKPDSIMGTLVNSNPKTHIKIFDESYKVVDDTVKIRMLTPTETERLQGFPDGWTEYGLDDNGYIVKNSNTQRYKQCGNAVTVNVVQFVISRLRKVLW